MLLTSFLITGFVVYGCILLGWAWNSLDNGSVAPKNRRLIIPVNNKVSSDGKFFVVFTYYDAKEGKFCAYLDSKDSYNAFVKADTPEGLDIGIKDTYEKMMKM